MSQPDKDTLGGRIYSRFLTELATTQALAQHEYRAVQDAVEAGTLGMETTVRDVRDLMETGDGENSEH